MTQNQTSKLENFVAYPLILVIGLYMLASAVVPFLNVNSHVFTVVFTLSGGIPTITLFFKGKSLFRQPVESKE